MINCVSQAVVGGFSIKTVGDVLSVESRDLPEFLEIW